MNGQREGAELDDEGKDGAWVKEQYKERHRESKKVVSM